MNVGNFMEHVAAGVSVMAIGRATQAKGSFVELFIRQDRHLKIHWHVRNGHKGHFRSCTQDEHCSSLQGAIASQQ
jgi:hypothetical protein